MSSLWSKRLGQWLNAAVHKRLLLADSVENNRLRNPHQKSTRRGSKSPPDSEDGEHIRWTLWMVKIRSEFQAQLPQGAQAFTSGSTFRRIG